MLVSEVSPVELNATYSQVSTAAIPEGVQGLLNGDPIFWPGHPIPTLCLFKGQPRTVGFSKVLRIPGCTNTASGWLSFALLF